MPRRRACSSCLAGPGRLAAWRTSYGMSITDGRCHSPHACCLPLLPPPLPVVVIVVLYALFLPCLLLDTLPLLVAGLHVIADESSYPPRSFQRGKHNHTRSSTHPAGWGAQQDDLPCPAADPNPASRNTTAPDVPPFSRSRWEYVAGLGAQLHTACRQPIFPLAPINRHATSYAQQAAHANVQQAVRAQKTCPYLPDVVAIHTQPARSAPAPPLDSPALLESLNPSHPPRATAWRSLPCAPSCTALNIQGLP
mmetsp:Transcript_41567/g.124269  ORF Transcript_41567/g.124269 Transcript_41567/m.124269 type:complete len:252 (-) Transcript_41567:1617-2372(-)